MFNVKLNNEEKKEPLFAYKNRQTATPLNALIISNEIKSDGIEVAVGAIHLLESQSDWCQFMFTGH